MKLLMAINVKIFASIMIFIVYVPKLFKWPRIQTDKDKGPVAW